LKEYLCYAKSLSNSDRQETRNILAILRPGASRDTEIFTSLEEENTLEKLVKLSAILCGHCRKELLEQTQKKITLRVDRDREYRNSN
jgi:hypothetical protein